MKYESYSGKKKSNKTKPDDEYLTVSAIWNNTVNIYRDTNGTKCTFDQNNIFCGWNADHSQTVCIVTCRGWMDGQMNVKKRNKMDRMHFVVYTGHIVDKIHNAWNGYFHIIFTKYMLWCSGWVLSMKGVFSFPQNFKCISPWNRMNLLEWEC